MATFRHRTTTTRVVGPPFTPPEDPQPHPLTNAADLLGQAAGLVEDAAREVALAAAQAPIGRIYDASDRHRPWHGPLGENPALSDLTKYAATLAGESQTLTGHSYTCRTVTQDGRDREALKNAGPLR